MERPKDVPEDVWDSACSEAAQYVEWLIPKPDEYKQSEHVLAVSFARAILSERDGVWLSLIRGISDGINTGVTIHG